MRYLIPFTLLMMLITVSTMEHKKAFTVDCPQGTITYYAFDRYDGIEEDHLCEE